MAHYAQINKDDIVVNVTVISDEFTEAVEWLTENYGPTWIMTSYNTRGGVHYNPETGEPDDGTPVHYNYASIGYKWDSKAKAFYDSIPTYPSWVLNTTTYTWETPTPKPLEWPRAVWNEPTVCWAEKPAPFFSWHYDSNINRWLPPLPMPDGIKAIWSEVKQAWIVIPPPYPSWTYDEDMNAWVPPVEPPDGVDPNTTWDWVWDDVAQRWYPAEPTVES